MFELIRLRWFHTIHSQVQRKTYWGGPHMIAIIFIMGTKYDCNLHNKEDQIWLQWWTKWGPNMNAIFITKGTKCDCNLKYETDHKCLQSYSIGTKYTSNIENLFSRNWSRNQSRARASRTISVIASIFGPFWIGLQLYMVRFVLEIASILCLLWNWDRIHIMYPLLFSLQAYLVPVWTTIASIFGPHHKNYCNHKWSISGP